MRTTMNERIRVCNSIILLLCAFSFAFFTGVATHEFGHAIALRYFGIKEVKIILHTFESSRVIWNVNNQYMGYVDAAGPLLNIFVGNSILILLWKKRSQYISPLILLGPMALIQEGFSSLTQLLFNIPGTDATRIVTSGIPFTIILGLAMLFLILGIATFILQLPLYGISPLDSFLRKLTILVPGLTAYPMVILLHSIIFNPFDFTRGVVIVLFSASISIIFAVLFKPINIIMGRVFTKKNYFF